MFEASAYLLPYLTSYLLLGNKNSNKMGGELCRYAYCNLSQKLEQYTAIPFPHSNFPAYHGVCSKPGGCQVPLSTCGCGRYVRKTILNESVGAGSQLDSLSGPGL
jgi:hypothetical protein